MSNLIITILSILLVAAMAIAGVYYGGNAMENQRVNVEIGKTLEAMSQVRAAGYQWRLNNPGQSHPPGSPSMYGWRTTLPNSIYLTGTDTNGGTNIMSLTYQMPSGTIKSSMDFYLSANSTTFLVWRLTPGSAANYSSLYRLCQRINEKLGHPGGVPAGFTTATFSELNWTPFGFSVTVPTQSITLGWGDPSISTNTPNLNICMALDTGFGQGDNPGGGIAIVYQI